MNKFINDLVWFPDLCQGFYGYQAYFLAAAEIKQSVFYCIEVIDASNLIALEAQLEELLKNNNPIALNRVANNIISNALENKKAIEALITLVHTKERDIVKEACNSLENILQSDFVPQTIFLLKEFIIDEIREEDYLLYKSCYKVIDRCSQIVPYSLFYQAYYVPNLKYY